MDWYYAANGKADGPHPFEDIKSLCLMEQINRDTLVWREGFTQWTTLGVIPEFQSLFRAAPPPVPPNPAPVAAVVRIAEPVSQKQNSNKISRWIYALHAWGAVALYTVTSNGLFPVKGGLVAAGSILAGWGISVALASMVHRLHLSKIFRRIIFLMLPFFYLCMSVAGLMLLNFLV